MEKSGIRGNIGVRADVIGRAQISGAPIQHTIKNRDKTFSTIGQGIFNLRGNFAVNFSMEKLVATLLPLFVTLHQLLEDFTV